MLRYGNKHPEGFEKLSCSIFTIEVSATTACLPGHPFESLNELRTAVGISAVVKGVNAYENVAAAENFSPSQGERQENRVARRDVGDGNAVGHLVDRTSLRNSYLIRERRAPEGSKIDGRNSVLGYTERSSDTTSGFQFPNVTLPIRKRECVGLITLTLGNRQNSRRVEATAQQYDSRLRIRFHDRLPYSRSFLTRVPSLGPLRSASPNSQTEGEVQLATLESA